MLPGPQQFDAEVVPAVCELVRDPDMREQALREAWEASDGGRNVIAHNWWHIEGQGDAGWYDCTTLVGAETGAVDGTVHVVRYAKFSCLPVAVAAWLSTHEYAAVA